MGIDADIVIAGGGIVGLFAAWRSAEAGFSVILMERDIRFGELASSRNSGVLHAGLYYRPGSNKARLCVAGNRESYALAERWQVRHRRCGKLLVALVPDEEAQLLKLKATGEANGAEGLKLVTRERIAALEPNIAGEAALWSQNTGIIDTPAFLAAVRAQAEQAGALILTHAEVERIEPESDTVTVVTKTRGTVTCRAVVNATGMAAASLAQTLGFTDFAPYPVRGSYATVIPRHAGMIRGLVYPVPSSKLSLGVHMTRTVDGELLVGPSAEVVDPAIASHTLDAYRAALPRVSVLPPVEDFLAAAKPLVPGLKLEHLRPGYFGIRPKVKHRDGTIADDFIYQWNPDGVPVLHLLGFESPAFTSAPAIGREVADMLRQRLY